MYINIRRSPSCFWRAFVPQLWHPSANFVNGFPGSGIGRTRSSTASSQRDGSSASTAMWRSRSDGDSRVSDQEAIRELDPERDAAGVVELIHEVFPAAVTTVEGWRQQHASVPARARRAAWVATVDDAIVARAEASLNWFSESRTAFAGVSVREPFRRRGIGGRLWELVEGHLRELAPTRVLSMFVETSEGVAFARARGFDEVRAETLSCVDPRTVDLSRLESPQLQLVPLRDIPPEEIFETEVATRADVPMTDRLDDIRFEDWLEA